MDKFKTAMDLLDRSGGILSEHPPDKTWWKDYFALTGQHMILTEEGWQGWPRESKFN